MSWPSQFDQSREATAHLGYPSIQFTRIPSLVPRSRVGDSLSFTPDQNLSIMNSQVYVGLSLLAVASLAGAGVAVGSGVAMVANQALEEQQGKAGAVVAHSPFERRVLNIGFAAAGALRN